MGGVGEREAGAKWCCSKASEVKGWDNYKEQRVCALPEREEEKRTALEELAPVRAAYAEEG